jgi:hypothetical protein
VCHDRKGGQCVGVMTGTVGVAGDATVSSDPNVSIDASDS